MISSFAEYCFPICICSFLVVAVFYLLQKRYLNMRPVAGSSAKFCFPMPIPGQCQISFTNKQCIISFILALAPHHHPPPLLEIQHHHISQKLNSTVLCIFMQLHQSNLMQLNATKTKITLKRKGFPLSYYSTSQVILRHSHAMLFPLVLPS